MQHFHSYLIIDWGFFSTRVSWKLAVGFSELGEEEEKARGFEVSAEGQRAVSKEYF